MLAYVDQNFLIDCAGDPERTDLLIQARAKGFATMVLCPWHFYEIGNALRSWDRILTLVDATDPSWTLAPVDLHTEELLREWGLFWNCPTPRFKPVRDIAWVASRLHRTTPGKFAGTSLKDFVRAFQQPSEVRELLATLKRQEEIAEINRRSMRGGIFTGEMNRRVEIKHVAIHIARIVGARTPSPLSAASVDDLSESILKDEPLLREQVKFFVEWGGMSNLRGFQVESYLTNRHYETSSVLGVNRFVDRMHAITGLPYCDLFVTSDRELLRRCQEARNFVSFPVAEAITGREFLERIEAQLTHATRAPEAV